MSDLRERIARELFYIADVDGFCWEGENEQQEEQWRKHADRILALANETGLREALEQLAKELESRRAKDGSPYECGLQNQAQRLAVKLRAIIAAGEGEER
jgi:predicted TIM-barrel fold metal-dependent hydrolase